MNLQNFAITRNGTVNVSAFPRYSITAQLQDTDPTTGLPTVVSDFTGANAIDFPAELKLRTPEERDLILQTIARMLVYQKAGVPLDTR
jgi:hypothetical protein